MFALAETIRLSEASVDGFSPRHCIRLSSTLLACGFVFHKYFSLWIEDPSLALSPVLIAEAPAPRRQFASGVFAVRHADAPKGCD